MERKPDWDLQLMKVIEAAATRPFSWGQHDCCLFAADCVEAMTGEDPMPDFRNQYDDAESARAALKEFGSGTLYHTLLSRFGAAQPARLARRGDLVYGVFETGPAVGVSVGMSAVFVGAEQDENGAEKPGLQTVPLSQTAKSFRI